MAISLWNLGRTILKSSVVIAWLVALAALMAVVVSAKNSNDLVIEKIIVPASLVPEKMPNGEFASLVAQRVRLLRAMTAEVSRSASVELPSKSWIGDIRAELPQTKLSFGDAYRIARRWLGDDIYATAEVFRRGEDVGVAISSRGRLITRKISPKLDLVDQLGEAFYASAYPALHAAYVSADPNRRSVGTSAFRQVAYEGETPRERAFAMNGLAANLIEFEGRCADAVPLLHRARRLNPRLPMVHKNLSDAYYCLGMDQEAADALREELRVLNRYGASELGKRKAQRLTLEAATAIAGSEGDYSRRMKLYDAMELEGFEERDYDRAVTLADNYDVAASLRLMSSDHVLSREPRLTAWLRFKHAFELSEWSEALKQLKLIESEYKRRSAFEAAQINTQILPIRAMVTARSGDLEGASALAATLPPNCYRCALARADVASRFGNRMAWADAWYRHAVRLAPRLPFAYAEWGRTKLEDGELKEATRLLQKAHHLAPRWAAPLKYLADAQSRAGHPEKAVHTYARSALLAPQWRDLHLAWSQSLVRSGREAEGEAKRRKWQLPPPPPSD